MTSDLQSPEQQFISILFVVLLALESIKLQSHYFERWAWFLLHWKASSELVREKEILLLVSTVLPSLRLQLHGSVNQIAIAKFYVCKPTDRLTIIN